MLYNLKLKIDTPPIFNTIDAVGPASSVTEAVNEYWTENIQVTWGGEDDGGSSLQDYDVYVSKDGGPYTVWLSHTNLTTAIFVGDQNHTYGFYSTARDYAGNAEAFPAEPDAEVTIPVYEYEQGDLNHDSFVNLEDAIILLKIINNISNNEPVYLGEDINNDGKLGFAELIYILQKVANQR